MRVQLVWASADWSIYDVSNGYNNALDSFGHSVFPFRLNRRIEFWSESLNHWAEITGGNKPHVADVLREASHWALVEAAKNQPDIILITCAMGFHPDALVFLRRCGFRTALILTESPYDDKQHEHIAPLVNYVFTNEQDSVPVLRQFNPATFYLPTAYDATVHSKLAAYNYISRHGHLDHLDTDVLFVGTGFGERQRFLTAVPWAELGVDFQMYGFWGFSGSGADPQAEANADLIGQWDASGLAPFTHEPITNDETAARYTHAGIVLNFYRDGSGFSMNPRAYEIAACGAFQLAQDSSAEAHIVFGDSIDYFKTPEELAEKIRYWTDPAHLLERQEKARIAHSLVNHHSYHQRVQTMFRDIADWDTKPDPAAPVSLSTSQPLRDNAPSLYPAGRVE